MSDLDDFFAKKLEEEASFPNRTKNWKQMSQRLDAFDSGAVQGSPPRLRLWQAAAIIAILGAGFLLWKLLETQQANKALQETVASLEMQHSTLKQQAAQWKMQAAPSAQPEEQPYSSMGKVQPITKDRNKHQSNENVQKSTHFYPKFEDNLGTKSFATPTEKEISQLSAEPASARTTLPDSVLLASTPLQNPDLPKPTDTITATRVSDISVAKPQDSVQIAPIPLDSVRHTSEKAKDSMALSAPIAQVVKPAKTYTKRFKVGTQATLGFVQPKQKGISAIRGQGITLEAKVLPSVWVTGSVDWLHHEVCTEGFVAKFHPKHDSFPNPPDNGGGGSGGWQHKPKLVLVESTPRQQNIGLGIRYVLPVEFWVRPSVALSHHWVHTSPSLVTYKFEEDDPGGPGPNPHNHESRYTAESFEDHWISNQWRMGLGIEKELANWTFGLSADYSKDFSASIPGFDALYLRAGAQYRF